MKWARRQVLWLGPAAALLAPLWSLAEGLPAKLATLVLLKVVSFDPAVKANKNDFVVLVIGGSSETKTYLGELGELATAKVQERKLRFVASDLATLEKDAKEQGGSAVLVVGGIDAERLTGLHALAMKLKLPTLTTEADFVRKLVAVGVRLRSGRPGIVINGKLANELGLTFDPAVMRVAETY